MKRDADIRETIIAAATALIRRGNGNIAEITTREIAREANVGAGLVNYHFQSKENLITLCVQRIIRQTVQGFSPGASSAAGDPERLTDWATRVFDFLFENAAVSRISILGDMADYAPDSNTVQTQKGFTLAVRRDMRAEDRNLLVFTLTSALQAAFLGRQTVGQRLGYNFEEQEDRHAFVAWLVSTLWNGTPQK